MAAKLKSLPASPSTHGCRVKIHVSHPLWLRGEHQEWMSLVVTLYREFCFCFKLEATIELRCTHSGNLRWPGNSTETSRYPLRTWFALKSSKFRVVTSWCFWSGIYGIYKSLQTHNDTAFTHGKMNSFTNPLYSIKRGIASHAFTWKIVYELYI